MAGVNRGLKAGLQPGLSSALSAGGGGGGGVDVAAILTTAGVSILNTKGEALEAPGL